MSPTNNQRSATMSDVRETAGMEVNADNPAPFVPTWGPEWEYVANNGTVFTFLLDDKSEVAPIKLTCEFGDVWFSRDGSAAFGASWVIVSQRPRTPAPVETPAPSQPADVPHDVSNCKNDWPHEVRQLLEDCAAEAADVIGNKLPWSRDSLEARFAPHFTPVLAIIARHAVAAPEVAERCCKILGHEQGDGIHDEVIRPSELPKRLQSYIDGFRSRNQDLIDEQARQSAKLATLRERLAVAEGEIQKLRSEQLTLARDYDPNCDDYDFEYQREVMKSAFRTIEAAQELARKLDRDPEGDLPGTFDYAAGEVERLGDEFDSLAAANAALQRERDKLAQEHAAALALVADIRAAIGDNGKRMQPELIEYCRRLSAAEAERDEAKEEAKRYCDQYSEAQRQRSMVAKSLEYAELEISRLQNERNDLGDSEIKLRAELARAKEDGEKMRELAARLADRLRQAQAQWKMYAEERIEYDDKGNEIYFSEADHAEADLWRNGEKALKESLAALAPRAAGAEENHIAEAGKMVAELHRQSLEAHMRGDLNTADRIATLIGDELPSKFEKDDLKAQHEEGGE